MDDKVIFDDMKHFFNVSSLESVAEKMGYSRSTASTWRSKGLTQTVIDKFHILKNKLNENDAIKEMLAMNIFLKTLETMRELTNAKSDKDMCDKLKIPYATLDTWKNRKAIPKKRLIEILEFLNVDKVTFERMMSDNVNVENIKEGYWITKLSHNASAGTAVDIEGVEVYDTDERIFLPTSFFKTVFKNSSLRVVEVLGDSMLPLLSTGDYVIIDINNRVLADGLYVINYQNVLMVKSLQFKLNGNILIKSLNPDYESYEVDKDSQSIFNIIGRVVKKIT